MSGVWVFDKGVIRLVENPGPEQMAGGKRKALIYTRTNEVITSYAVLETKLNLLGWERYCNGQDLLQFHKSSGVHLISLPTDFNEFKLRHMYDIVVQTRNFFEVRDICT